MDDLREDVEAVDESMDDLAEAVERLVAAAEEDRPDVAEDDLVRAWFDVLVEHRVQGLLLDDIRWEVKERRREAGEARHGGRGDADIGARLDDLSARREAIGDRLDDITRAGWLRRRAGDLSALDRDLARLEPPIDWEAVRETLEAHRADTDGDAG